jgi:hypothetical protein
MSLTQTKLSADSESFYADQAAALTHVGADVKGNLER